MLGYSFGDSVRNIFSYLYTKLVWRGARLVRLPLSLRNRKNISYGKGFTCGVNCRLNPGPNGQICIGSGFVMGDNCQIEAMDSVTIGDNVLLASRVYIGDSNHGRYSGAGQSSPDIAPNVREIVSRPISIGNNVWIGNGVCILSGVSIGDGTIVGANAVVSESIPKNSIAVGVPARVIKTFDSETQEWMII